MHKTGTYERMPDVMMNQLIEYVEKGKIPCPFLCACIANDFQKAVARADEYNTEILPLYAHFIHWEFPQTSWGSYDAIEEWAGREGNNARNLKQKYWRN